MVVATVCLTLLFAVASFAAGPVRASIPFPFEADGVQLPSGQYVIAASGAGAVTLRADAPGANKVTVETAVDRYASGGGCSCVRFHRYADGRYVLSDVQSWEVVSAMKKSRREYPMEAVEVPLLR